MEANQDVLDPSTHSELVRLIAARLRAHYVFPDVAEQICACLQKHEDDGEYSDIAEGEFLAYALTTHMQEVNHDEHLWVRWHPEPLPDGEGPLRHNTEWSAARQQEAQLDNYGLHRVERLPGNVGYIDIRYFHRPTWGGDTAVAAMSFLAHAQALIVDLRRCTGGYPGMIVLIASYLFDGEPVHLSSVYWREDDVTQQFWTLPYVPGRRLGDRPVYVLIGKDTYSGGEELAYDLQACRRATLVGQKTDGGAHPGVSCRLHPHFEVFIPVGRAINPTTGGNWEGTGVTPDVTASLEQSFRVAYTLALESIIASLGESPVEPFKALAEEARTTLQGLRVADAG